MPSFVVVEEGGVGVEKGSEALSFGRSGEQLRTVTSGGVAGHRTGGRRGHLRSVADLGHTIRVLVVDRRPIVRAGLRSLLATEGGMKAVGEARCGADALQLARALRPDVVILDLTPEGRDIGSATCREMKELPGAPRLLFYTDRGTAEDLADAVLKGADGYVHKDLEEAELATSIRRVGSGEHVWLPKSGRAEATGPPRPVSGDACLTRREQEVYALLSERFSNEEIARKLNKSLYTVKNQVSSIFRKLGVGSRKELFWSFQGS